MSGAETIVLEVFAGLLKAAPVLIEVITGQGRKTLEERIERARSAIKDPIDPSADDAARRAELERIVHGASSR